MSIEEVSVIFHGIPLLIKCEYFKSEKERGERGFSLGTPAEPAHVVIDEIQINGPVSDDELNQFLMEEIFYDRE